MTTARERIALMMEELGPACPAVSEVIAVGDDVWGVELEDETQLMVRHLDDRIELLATIGIAAMPDAIDVYKAALRYNMLCADTQMLIALDTEDDSLTLLRMVQTDELALDALVEVLLQFATMNNAWARFLITGSLEI